MTLRNLLTPPLDYPKELKPNITRWVMPGWYYADTGTGQLVTDGDIVYQPIFVSHDTIYNRIGVHVLVAAAGGGAKTLELRIYNWENGLPTSQVLAPGTVSLAAAPVSVEIVISQLLTRGYYFLAMRSVACGGAGQLMCPLYTAAISPPVPGLGLALANPMTGIVLTCTAAMADPAPAPTAYGTVSEASILLREN